MLTVKKVKEKYNIRKKKYSKSKEFEVLCTHHKIPNSTFGKHLLQSPQSLFTLKESCLTELKTLLKKTFLIRFKPMIKEISRPNIQEIYPRRKSFSEN